MLSTGCRRFTPDVRHWYAPSELCRRSFHGVADRGSCAAQRTAAGRRRKAQTEPPDPVAGVGLFGIMRRFPPNPTNPSDLGPSL